MTLEEKNKKHVFCLTIHWHFIYLCAVILLNISQYSDVIRFHKINGNTFTTKPARPTNSRKDNQIGKINIYHIILY